MSRPQIHQERRKAYQQWRAEHPAFGVLTVELDK